MKPSPFKIIAGFNLLFLCYHSAEYMILSQNSAAGFLFLSTLFFVLAFLLAKWQGDKNLAPWGLALQKSLPVYLTSGLLAGLVISSLSFFTCLALHIEVVSLVPPLKDFLPTAALLIFGSAVSSLTEDLLTRGYVYRHTKSKISRQYLALLSAIIYVLNHVHRLNEPVYLLYVFVLGLALVLPLLITGNIWYTLGVHWAGNIVYHLTSNVMHTSSGDNAFPALWISIVFTLLSIPLHCFICQQLTSKKENESFVSPLRHSSTPIRHSSELV
ncbi:CPBP family intramembrane glutamic endopeptidase [Flavisolibacter ginsenosidimutans]|uniref:CPBP family intramembrane metalloprotease n=1 Tax=Flavisolibacter ginsenosidimutans TaxID=661481 RepID=A0A5B8ULH3_9BACT|nr:CPBP family intramembrane glutamic endopeptidase [Flavisolibacter ginsenosidimutans]QEC57517.1 CPBP family intramembrane metalloprotease [Flavisolibacter ginsenosidimutans]